MAKLRGLQIKPKALAELKAVLSDWLDLMDDPTWGPKDAPWWYNERASLGTLAGAFWRQKGWAFEEYATSRWNGGVRSNGRATSRLGWTIRPVGTRPKQNRSGRVSVRCVRKIPPAAWKLAWRAPRQRLAPSRTQVSGEWPSCL